MPNSATAGSAASIALLNGSSSAAASSSASHPFSHPLPTHPHLHHPTSSSSSSFPKGSFFASAAGAIASPTKNHRSSEPSSSATNGTIGPAENGDANNGQQPLTLILTVRMLMQGKEVGSIIGKRGDYVRQIREHSGAKINISDGSCPERIVTISGSSSSINKAFAMVAQKFEEDMQAQQNAATLAKPPVTLRLLVPASQCGSLIGKGGAKIREIRDKTGASLQVASEMLSNSTEKAVTISGSSEALIGCMREVCQILLDAPAKGPTIQYKPVNQAYNPLAVANSAAAIAAATAAVTAAQQKGMPCGLGTTAGGVGGAMSPQATAAAQLAALLPQTNPTLFSVQEQLALLQQQQQKQHLLLQQHHPNSALLPFPIDPIVSRFLLQPAAAAAGLPVPSSASTAAVSNALLTAHPFLLINNHLQNTVPSQAVAANPKIDGLEVYGAAAASGLDPATLALLQQQQQHQAVDAMAMLQQQQIQQQMMLYQQQQQQLDIGGHESGRAITASSKSEKKSGDGTAASSGTTQHKRFTPY